MIITIILVLISLVALAFFMLAAARGRALPVSDISELQEKTEPVDVLAFRNLTNPQEERYLRAKLPAREFRMVQRKRMRAAIAYVDCVSRNAAVLLRLGEAARHSTNPEIAEAGLRLVNDALRVRLHAVSARAHLYAALLIPGVPVSSISVTGFYEQLSGSASRLGYLQDPMAAPRTSAAL